MSAAWTAKFYSLLAVHLQVFVDTLMFYNYPIKSLLDAGMMIELFINSIVSYF